MLRSRTMANIPPSPMTAIEVHGCVAMARRVLARSDGAFLTPPRCRQKVVCGRPMNAPLVQYLRAQIAALELQLQATREFLAQVEKQERAAVHEPLTAGPEWVYIKRAAELLGTTQNAIYSRIYNGTYLEGRHYRRERPIPGSRLPFNVKAIGSGPWPNDPKSSQKLPPASKSTMTGSASGSNTRAGIAMKRGGR